MPEAPTRPTCAAIIVAAGSGRRMGFDKLAAPLRGKPVLQRTLEAFLTAPSISEIIVVCPEERWPLIADMNFTKPVTRTDGGAERQDSVAAGMARISPDIQLVAVHDGARPLVASDDIDRCVAAAREHRSAVLARRVTETLKRSDANDYTTGAVDRQHLWFMETPQVFEIRLLRDAYSAVAAQSLHVTDEVSALEGIGIPVKLVEAVRPNLKITTPADLALAEALIL